jgi:hypothetical protein
MVLSLSVAPHDVASRRVTCAHRDPPPLGSERRGSRLPADLCAVGTPVSNRLFDPLPVRHVLTPAAPATQRRRRRTRVAPPLVGDWPPCVAAHPAVLRPCRGPCHDLVPLVRKKTFLTALCTAIKPAGLLPTRAPSRCRPPWVPHGELHPRILFLTNT